MEIKLARPLPNGIGRVSQWFGENPKWYTRWGYSGHPAVDYACPIGTPVLATHTGTVQYRPADPTGYGTYIWLRGAEYDTLYAHLSSILVPDGAQVSAGTFIALSGNSGNSTGPHLHWAAQIHGMRNPCYGNFIDPVPFREG